MIERAISLLDTNRIFYDSQILWDESRELLSRISYAALPLICMNPAASTFVYCAFQAKELKTALLSAQPLSQTAWLVTKIAVSILLPKIHLFTVHASNLHSSFVAGDALGFFHALMNLGLIIFGGKELLVISLLLQALKEFKTSIHFFNQSSYVEAGANLIYALLRVHSAIPHSLLLHRNWCGKEMSQADFDKLLLEIKEVEQDSEFIDFENLLIKHHFKNRISEITFRDQKIANFLFKNLVFQDVDFKNCWIDNSRFQNVEFNQCDMTSGRFIFSIFENSRFSNSMMNEVEFTWSHFFNTLFDNSDLTAATFNSTLLQECKFTLCNLMESTFFKAKVQDSIIADSNLQDALLFETKNKFSIYRGIENTITRPINCLLYRFDKRSTSAKAMDESLKDIKGLVLKIHPFPENSDLVVLEKEVKEALDLYHTRAIDDKRSILQFIVENANDFSEIGKIRAFAEEILGQINGLVIPGGDDVEPEFYGQTRIPETETYKTPYRTILEASMLFSAENKKIPVLTICRGTQVLNVAFGGTLKQDISDHWDVFHLLKITKEKAQTKIGQYVKEILKGRYIIGHSKHHQAVDEISPKFDAPLSQDDHPELLVSHMENEPHPLFIGLQFHPEMVKFDPEKLKDFHGNNNNFFKNFLERVNYFN